jgi:tetratricopeptide (TPR) repeat protein
VSKSTTLGIVILTCCVPTLLLHAEDASNKDLDRQYQLAVSNYDSGKYAEAAGQLEKLLPYATKSSPVHELLGMVYVSLSQQDKAIEQLKVAVQLKPDWAEARTNLGAALLQSGKTALAEEQFKKAVSLEPTNYDANHNLAEFYVGSGKVTEALPLFERAYAIDPAAYDNGYDLALAEFQVGHADKSRAVAMDLAKSNNTGELHNLLGHLEEKQGDYVAAANDYETATHLDPSEDNFFDWGCEMLMHRTYEPAITIFEEAARRYSSSPRILIGLGLSLYARGKYDDAVSNLLNAVTLNPGDPRGYTFLSEAYESSPAQTQEVIEAFKKYSETQPTNALAQYDYAMSLWKGYRQESASFDRSAVESLLLKAIALDDSLADAHEQLGNLYSDQREYAKSAPQYKRALELNPNSADAHYRLGTDYVHLGQKDEAQEEFAVYQKLRAEHLDELEKQRAEVRQFVYSESATPGPKKQ